MNMVIFFLVIMYLMVSVTVTLLYENLGVSMTPAAARRSIGFGLFWPVSVPYVIVRGIYRVCAWLVSDLSPFKKHE